MRPPLRVDWLRVSAFALGTLPSACTTAAPVAPRADPSERSPEAVEPPPVPSAGTLYFFSDRTGNGDIYTHDLNTGREELWIGGPEPQFGPRWLPEARELRWLAELDDGLHIFAGDAASPRDLGLSPAGDVTPAWSADGSIMAYPAPHDTGARLTLRQGQRELVLEDFDLAVAELALSPEGTTVVFAAGPDGARNLYRATWDPASFAWASAPRALTDTAASEGHPSFSADGSVVVFDRSPEFGVADIWELDLKSGSERQLTCHPRAELVPRLSPDGSQVVFGSNRHDQWEVYRTPRDRCEPVRVTDAPSFDSDAGWR